MRAPDTQQTEQADHVEPLIFVLGPIRITRPSTFSLALSAVAVFGFVYLVLLARAVSLDERVNQLDRQIAHAQSQRIVAEQELRSALTPDALGLDLSELSATTDALASITVTTPPLPAIEPCPVLLVADTESVNGAGTADGVPGEEQAEVIASAQPPG